MSTATTAFVLSGGGSLGAVQVGMLQALAHHHIRPDLLVGTSAGAMNAAWVGGHGMSADSLDELAEVWVGLHRSDVFHVGLRRVVGGLLGRRAAVASEDGLRDLVTRHTGFADLADAKIPVHFVAADVLSGRSVLVSHGPVTTGLLASTAIPGVFPPVTMDGRVLMDGALADRSGVSHAVDLGATEIYLLPSGSPCALAHPPASAIGLATHALSLLLEQRLVAEVAALADRAKLRVLPPLCPLAVPATDFTHAAELVARGRRSALDWMASGGTELPSPERFLTLHHHRSGIRPPGLTSGLAG
ncbi:patatin-like phospholipase family protein [Intrasporangium mesophilum]